MEERTGSEEGRSRKHWYALYTRPRHEFKAAGQLEESSIEYYLPVTVQIKQWSDRKKKITEPLIRGYIFVHADEKERLSALQKDSIVRCVAFDNKIAVIPDWQIESLKAMIKESSNVEVSDRIAAGTKVQVVSGPLQGVVGVVNDTSNGRTISITIELLNRSVTALLSDENDIKVIGSDK